MWDIVDVPYIEWTPTNCVAANTCVNLVPAESCPLENDSHQRSGYGLLR